MGEPGAAGAARAPAALLKREYSVPPARRPAQERCLCRGRLRRSASDPELPSLIVVTRIAPDHLNP
jgi:hypothetical protein